MLLLFLIANTKHNINYNILYFQKKFNNKLAIQYVFLSSQGTKVTFRKKNNKTIQIRYQHKYTLMHMS